MPPARWIRRPLRRIAAWTCVCATLAASVSGHGAGAPADPRARSAQAVPVLSDDDFFAPSLDPALTAALLESRFVGIALRAPARVDLEQHAALPLYVASRFDGARDWALPYHELALLVGIDADSGRVAVAPAFASPKRASPTGRGAKPAADEARRHGAQWSRVDARSRLDLSWQPACWSFTIVYHDWVSNPVSVHLQRPSMPGSGEVCPARASTARARVDFRRRDGPAGAVGVAGRLSLPVRGPGAAGTTLPATLLIVSPDGATPERHDWTIALEARPGARLASGVIDRRLPSAFQSRAGAVAYLVVAGQVHGPRAWTAATKAARP